MVGWFCGVCIHTVCCLLFVVVVVVVVVVVIVVCLSCGTFAVNCWPGLAMFGYGRDSGICVCLRSVSFLLSFTVLSFG